MSRSKGQKIQFQSRMDAFWKSKEDKNGFIQLQQWPDIPKPEVGDYWGKWQLKKGYLIINEGEKHSYDIELDRAKTIDECANWIFHMQEKSWLSDGDLAQLVRAFSDIQGISR